jgi:hypothetical protein
MPTIFNRPCLTSAQRPASTIYNTIPQVVHVPTSAQRSVAIWDVSLTATGRNCEQFRWYWPWHLIIIYKLDQIDEADCMFIDIYDCDNTRTVTSHSEINIVISLGKIPVLFLHRNLSISQTSPYWISRSDIPFYYIICKFAWKSCIFIGLQEGDILGCHPPECVTSCLSVTLLWAKLSPSCKPMKMKYLHVNLHKIF